MLRCAVLKHLPQETCRGLEFTLRDSRSAQRFARVDAARLPRKSALQATMGAVRATTWERINRRLLGVARDAGVETGERVRIDSTVTGTHILEPADSRLLYDGVRVPTRLLVAARDRLGADAVAFDDHRRAAKRRSLEIQSQRGAQRRAKTYRKLLRLVSRTLGHVERRRVDAVPIVDTTRRLMGVVRHERVYEAVEEAASADIQKMVGGSDEQALSSPWFAVRQRLPWLHINLLTAFLAAAVVGVFEDIIARITALAILLPVVAGQSGNAGAQALAVTMRGLVLREIGMREWPLVLGKELVVGLANGALAVTCGLGVYLWSSSLGLALVIGLAMVLAMVAAALPVRWCRSR